MADLQHIKSLSLICVLCLFSTASAQQLAELRNEVRAPTSQPQTDDKKPDPPRARGKHSSKRGYANDPSRSSLSNSHCDDDDDDSFWGKAMFAGLSSPFWLPRSMAGDDSFDSGYFLRYPYLHDQDAAIDEYLYSPEVNRHLMVRARSEYVSNFDSLSKLGGSVLFDTSSRWGLDSEFNYRREDLGASKDDLWTGDLNLVYRFAQSEQLQMRTGIGSNWLSDRSKSDFGFNFTYGGDWFPTKPIIVSHEIDWGKLGRASLFHGRITVGANYHRFEPYVGYEYYSIGKSDIHGMVFGARLWLSRF